MTLYTDLGGVVGTAHTIDDADAMAGYLTDWTGRFTGAAEVVVRPRDTAEVAEVLTVCAAHGAVVCPQGGNTGLVGGSVPPERGSMQQRPVVVLSTTRMVDIEAIDEVGRCVGVQAGVTVADLDRHAGAAGLAFGVDLASRESATVGGVVATNAGGIRMIRHGNTRAQLLGIEAVFADGRILRRWSPLVKDNVGYDISGLLAGSEGTLAVITGALLRLVAPTVDSVVAVAALDEVDTALAVLGAVAGAGLTVEAAEIMTAAGVELVHRHGARRPFAAPSPYLLLIEVSGAGAITDRVAQVFTDIPGILDTVGEPGPARALWQVRECHTEAIARDSRTPVVKLDVSFPLRMLSAAFAELSELREGLDYPCRPILFGHIGDGNIHVNLLDVPQTRAEELTERVFALVARLGGSISAEHGIGRAKTGWVNLGRGEVDRKFMAGIKRLADPDGRMNPGVLFGERSLKEF